jgi:hypothetical protein
MPVDVELVVELDVELDVELEVLVVVPDEVDETDEPDVG